MKTIYLESPRLVSLDTEKLEQLEKMLPETIYIAYSIQYKILAHQIHKILGKKVIGISQILGCSSLKTPANAILLIGTGRFHAINIALSSGKEVFTFPDIGKVDKKEIEILERKEKGKYLRFLASSNIGILISIKNGQSNINGALALAKNINNSGKKPYLFLADNIAFSDLDNFSLESWINTACPDLSNDSPIFNYTSLGKYQNTHS
jgi:diphthamide biosynthesis enzyme Dph1/Dph2-like protein